MSNKRIMLTVDDDLANALNEIKGFGTWEAEKCANIIRAYLAEHGYFDKLNNVTPSNILPPYKHSYDEKIKNANSKKTWDLTKKD